MSKTKTMFAYIYYGITLRWVASHEVWFRVWSLVSCLVVWAWP